MLDQIFKVLKIINQLVWIAVGLASLYSVYWFITQNPLGDLVKNLGSITNPNPSQLLNIQQNPEFQKLFQQNLPKK